MNVCMISPYPPQTGGVPVHASGLVRYLSKDNRIFIITYGRLGRKPEKNVEFLEVPVPNIKGLRGLCFFIGALVRLRSLMKKEKINVIHCHYMHPPGTVGALYRKLSGRRTRLIITAHGSDLLSLARGRFAGRLVRWAGNSCDRLICVSRHLAGQALVTGISKKKLAVVYNGIDGREFPGGSREELRRELGLPARSGIVTFAGALTEEKGADVFAILAKHLAARHPRLVFVMVGDGPERGWVKRFCRKNGLQDVVMLAGRKSHEDALKYIKASDVLVVPSAIEGFGMSALEAAAMCVPVAALPNGALPEILSEHSVSENLPALVTKIIGSDKFRGRLVSENKRLAREFSLRKTADETEKIYKRS